MNKALYYSDITEYTIIISPITGSTKIFVESGHAEDVHEFEDIQTKLIQNNYQLIGYFDE